MAAGEVRKRHHLAGLYLLLRRPLFFYSLTYRLPWLILLISQLDWRDTCLENWQCPLLCVSTRVFSEVVGVQTQSERDLLAMQTAGSTPQAEVSSGVTDGGREALRGIWHLPFPADIRLQSLQPLNVDWYQLQVYLSPDANNHRVAKVRGKGILLKYLTRSSLRQERFI